MKTLVLGDIHGRTIWKQIIGKEEFDRIIFIGDYFDSIDYHADHQMNNFLDIIEYKKNGGKEVILLVGNHDYHYIEGVEQEYSGWQKRANASISFLIKDNLKHLQMAYEQDNILFTHAGVTKTFLKEIGWAKENVADFLNDVFEWRPLSFRFVSGYDRTGDNTFQSCIWVRPRALAKDSNLGMTQVVGHTAQEHILDIANKKNRYLFIDTLGTSKQYLSITDDNIKIETCKM